MTYTTLISTQELAAHLHNPDWVAVDCRFSLKDTERGRRDYLQSHIAGAVYAHLDDDLCAPIIPGKTGRHPWPDVETFTQTLSKWGIDHKVQVVAYDDLGGDIAVRLWWMLRWLGHEAAAVLEGGWSYWQGEGHPVRGQGELRQPRMFVPHPRPELLVGTEDVLKIRTDSSFRLCDARTPERYRGEHEPLDPVAGHIPGAISLPFTANLDAEGRFLPPEVLRSHYQTRLGRIPPERTVFYCGSGVTAIHDILAMAHAGLGEARLYTGSWSKWITDPERPVATG